MKLPLEKGPNFGIEIRGTSELVVGAMETRKNGQRNSNPILTYSIGFEINFSFC
jgi:hypothetical protein